MKKKMTRFISFAAILVLLMSALSACGGKESGDSSKSETIKVITSNGASKELVTRLVGEFNNKEGKEKGIVIEYSVLGGDYKKTIDMALASGQAPDMFNVQGGRKPYVQNGDLMALEDLPLSDGFLKKYEGALSPLIEIFDGKTYAVPFGMTTIGLIYNKDLFKKYGLVDANGDAKPPETLKEMAEYAKIITHTDEKIYGIALPLKWGGFSDWHISMPASAYNARSYNRQSFSYNFSEFAPSLETLLQIKKDKSYFPGAEGLDNDTARAQFAEGRIGMITGASWDVGVLNDQFIAKCDWGVAPLPSLTADKKYKQSAAKESFVEISKSAASKNLNKIAYVYEWFNSDAFISELYSQCQVIPYDSKIIDKTKVNVDKKGWLDFSKMVERSYMSTYPTPTLKVEGDSSYDTFLNIWAEKVSPEEGLNDLDNRYNAALQKAVADGTVDPADYKGSEPDYSYKAN